MLHRSAVLVFAVLALAFALPEAARANPFTAAPEGAPSGSSAGPSPFAGAQGDAKEEIADALRRFVDEPGPWELLVVLGASFLYGALHAAGPGHRKTVVFSLFIGRQAAWWEPAAAGFLSAGVHALAGLVLLFGLGLLRGAAGSLASTDLAAAWTDGFAMIAVAAFASFLAVKAAIEFAKGVPRTERKGGAGIYSMLAIASVVPCPGAVLVVMFASWLGAFWLGVASFAAMSVGMGLVVSSAGYLAWFGRETLFNGLKRREKLLARLSYGLEFASYVLLLALALRSAIPFLSSVL